MIENTPKITEDDVEQTEVQQAYIDSLINLLALQRQLFDNNGIRIVEMHDNKIHVYVGIERMATVLGLDLIHTPTTIEGYPHEVYFEYCGSRFFQILSNDDWKVFEERVQKGLIK